MKIALKAGYCGNGKPNGGKPKPRPSSPRPRIK